MTARISRERNGCWRARKQRVACRGVQPIPCSHAILRLLAAAHLGDRIFVIVMTLDDVLDQQVWSKFIAEKALGYKAESTVTGARLRGRNTYDHEARYRASGTQVPGKEGSQQARLLQE